jgi:hypothetical protein
MLVEFSFTAIAFPVSVNVFAIDSSSPEVTATSYSPFGALNKYIFVSPIFNEGNIVFSSPPI